MFIKYKVVERGHPGAGIDGPKKFYASVSSNGELDMDDLIAKVEEISTASGADIRAVIYALFAVMRSSIAEGKIVRLGELGSLCISISSHGEDTEDAVSANSIRSSKVRLIPSRQVKKMLKTLEFRRA